MMQYLELGQTPGSENCAQVGADNYYEVARKECNCYRRQLIRQFGEPPGEARFGVKSFPHDFGSYMDVVIYYDDGSEEEVEFAFNVENNLPEIWDDVALQELRVSHEN